MAWFFGIAGLFIGAGIGFFVAILCVSAKTRDEMRFEDKN